MRKTVENMPLSERLAPQILTQEGFREIHWESLMNWRCHYDFTATKNGHKYLIEVKPNLYSIDREKLQHLKRFNTPVLFLIVNPTMKEYALLPLEALEKEIGEIGISKEGAIIRLDGRTTIPDAIRKAVNIEGLKAICEVENYGENKILLTILTRFKPTKRNPGKDVVKR